MSRHYRWIIGSVLAIYWTALCVATHLPPTHVPNMHISDKLEHFGAYGLLTALICAFVPLTLRRTWWTAALLWAIVGLYGAIDENTQPYFNRTCDLHDWYADMVGATVAIIGMSLIVRCVFRRPSDLKSVAMSP